MNHDLFVSYSRVDSAFVLRLVRDLRGRGVEIWLDQLDIPPGANWDDEIEKALDAAKTVIVILSGASGKSENVKNEIGAALERDKQIVPVVLAKSAVPLMINRLQREDFTGEYQPALDHLVRRLSGGGKTASLRAITADDIERMAREAAARLAASEPAPHAPLDSLSPAGRIRAESPPRARRVSLWAGGAVAAFAVGIAIAVGTARAPIAPPTPPAPPDPVVGGTGSTPPLDVAGDGGTGAVPDNPVVDPDAVKPKPKPKPEPKPRPKPDPSGAGAVLCREPRFGGLCETIMKSTNLASSKVGIKTVTSFRLGTCAAVRICSGTEFRGGCLLFRKDHPDLSATRLGDDNVSSIECFAGEVTPRASGGTAL